MKLATKINLFNVYTDGDRQIGIDEEVTMPDFEAMTETLAGPGISGEIEEPIIGLFGSSEVEVPYQTIHDGVFAMLHPGSAVDITLRASTQVKDASGNTTFEGVRVVLRGLFKSLTSGSMKQGAGTKSSIKFEVTYCLYEVNGTEKLEIDKFNQIYKINGVDILEAARALC